MTSIRRPNHTWFLIIKFSVATRDFGVNAGFLDKTPGLNCMHFYGGASCNKFVSLGSSLSMTLPVSTSASVPASFCSSVL